jgi:hypothetical protein
MVVRDATVAEIGAPPSGRRAVARVVVMMLSSMI